LGLADRSLLLSREFSDDLGKSFSAQDSFFLNLFLEIFELFSEESLEGHILIQSYETLTVKFLKRSYGELLLVEVTPVLGYERGLQVADDALGEVFSGDVAFFVSLEGVELERVDVFINLLSEPEDVDQRGRVFIFEDVVCDGVLNFLKFFLGEMVLSGI
jgi:hypothetical protein